MKRNDIKKLHELSIADLNKKLTELVAQLATARLEKRVGRLANPRLVSNLSDDVARIKTVMREKETKA
jgi:large subunit ribosomal protein L29